jgi:hypothetical protein
MSDRNPRNSYQFLGIPMELNPNHTSKARTLHLFNLKSTVFKISLDACTDRRRAAARAELSSHDEKNKKCLQSFPPTPPTFCETPSPSLSQHLT